MQLKQKRVAGILSAATAALLGGASQAAENEWEVDTAVLYYDEGDRVSAFEPVISASKDIGDGEILSHKLVIDSLTGASASGAVPSTRVQTFTRPSGRGSYTVDPNETPLDTTFKDTRVSYSFGWEKPQDRDRRRNLGFTLSREYDFTSLSGNAMWQIDSNARNTTWSYGINLELDAIDPVGGAPTPFSDMLAQDKGGSEDRHIVDLLFGVTQVIDRTSLFQVNLSLSEADGYLTDPYKLLSVVDDDGEPLRYLFESRPDSRSRQSVFAKYKKMLPNKDIFTASYRFMTDDWGVDSNTFDLNYRFRLGSGYYLQPRLRWYQQSEADFYRYFLRDGEALPGFASADYRLGEMDATTVGFKFGRDIDERQSWSLRLEQYVQSGEGSPSEALGQLANQDLFPDVEATIVQFNYSFLF